MVSPAALLSATTLHKTCLSVVERGVEVVVIDGVGVGDLDHADGLVDAWAVDVFTQKVVIAVGWHGLPARERDPKRPLWRLGNQTHGQDGRATSGRPNISPIRQE